MKAAKRPPGVPPGQTCPDCKGDGEWWPTGHDEAPCRRCDGEGRLPVPEFSEGDHCPVRLEFHRTGWGRAGMAREPGQ